MEEWEYEETEGERSARENTQIELSETSQGFVDDLVTKLVKVANDIAGEDAILRPYQEPFVRRLFESLIISDGARITALFSRQCLDGDTIVFRRDGTAVRLKDHEDAWSTGIKPTRRYRIRGGPEIVATDNHPVLTPDGWVQAGLLREGDLVSVVTGLEAKGGIDPGVLTARLLGYFATDGTWGKTQSAKFTNIREMYLEEFSSMMKDAFGITVKRYAKGNGADLLITGSPHGNSFRDYLKTLDWDDQFPTQVFSWTREAQAEFINRAWSGDGCITMKKSGPDIFLACGNSEVNARYWQALLLRFGISSTVKREHLTKGTGTFHRLVVSNGARSVRAFFHAFGLVFGKEKQSQAALDYLDANAALPSGKGRTERVVAKHWGIGPDGEELAWTRVIAIEDSGEREVFDVEYKGKGWFIAQGVQVHNSGKTEAVADVVVTAMIMLPLLARAYPAMLGKFKQGIKVGVFAPVEDQAMNLYERIVDKLKSERVTQILNDPEINDKVIGRGACTRLRRLKSLVRKKTCHPKARVEGWTYHFILVDEAQGADNTAIKTAVTPMGASTEATHCYTGTPAREKNFFFDLININKRIQVKRGKHRQNHFQADWKEVKRHVPAYGRQVQRDMIAMGEDSDDFRLSYKLEWILDKGMFTTSERLDELGDRSMQSCVHNWYQSPVVAGIDCARKKDRTVVTVVLPDWNNEDPDGFIYHAVLDWLDLEGKGWEDQYPLIVEFLRRYRIWKVNVDAGGIGDVVVARLRVLMPDIIFVEALDQPAEASDRWKWLSQLMDRSQISWPAGAKVKPLRKWRRFYQEMSDLLIDYKGGGNIKCAAPTEDDAHDDYPNSLNLACYLTKPDVNREGSKQFLVYENILIGRNRRR